MGLVSGRRLVEWICSTARTDHHPVSRIHWDSTS